MTVEYYQDRRNCLWEVIMIKMLHIIIAHQLNSELNLHHIVITLKTQKQRHNL